MIRLAIPSIEEDDLIAVRECIQSGFLVQGKNVAAFESAMADLCGTRHAVAVANCTCALHLALLALDVVPGDVCIVPAYSWISTANVVELCGAQTVFVDIQHDTFNMDPAALELTLLKLLGNVEANGKVKAVLPVHAFGLMANMPEINRICAKFGVPVIEDAACALGSTWSGQPAGGQADMGCFSFHPRKAVTTGEGGMITLNDDALLRKLRALRNHGLDPNAAVADFILPGHNYRLTEFQAAMGLTQAAKLERITAARRLGAARYDGMLEQSRLTAPRVPADASHVFQSYVTLLPAEIAPRRAELIKRCRENGVEVQVGTIHMPLTSYFRRRYGYGAGDFPVTDDVASRALTLPLYESITAEQQAEVLRVVNQGMDEP